MGFHSCLAGVTIDSEWTFSFRFVLGTGVLGITLEYSETSGEDIATYLSPYSFSQYIL